jgi:hypothetical protein
MKSETQRKIFVAMERLWLFAAIFCVACTLYFLIVRDNDSALYFFAFFILSSLFYILRRKQRRRFDERNR